MPYIKPNAHTAPFPNYSFFSYAHLDEKEVKKKMGVYLIINEISKKVYVGSSINIYNRWREHKRRLRGNNHHSHHLQNAWNKYGEECFSFTVIKYTDDKNEVRQIEQYYLDFMKPKYNNAPFATSTLGVKHTDKSKATMSANHADVSGDKNPMYGIQLNGESNPMYGRQRNDTANFNVATKKGRSWEDMYGKEKSDRMKADLKEVLKSRKGTDFTVIQKDLGSNIIKEFTSAHTAAVELKIGSVHSVSKKIRNNCNGKSKSAVGFIWQYKNKTDDKI